MSVSEDILVFLCHSSGDKEHVRQLYHQLTADGVRCWFDEEDLLPGQDWESEISKAIRRSRFVLACISNSSISKSGFVQKELRLALDVAGEQPDGPTFLIPVRLEQCEIPDRLKRWQAADLFNLRLMKRSGARSRRRGRRGRLGFPGARCQGPAHI
jgi:TIR domain